MNEVHYWIYQYAPEWSAETWAYVVLGMGIVGAVLRFVVVRTKNRVDDKLSVGWEFAEAETANLRRRAMKREHDEAEAQKKAQAEAADDPEVN